MHSKESFFQNILLSLDYVSIWLLELENVDLRKNIYFFDWSTFVSKTTSLVEWYQSAKLLFLKFALFAMPRNKPATWLNPNLALNKLGLVRERDRWPHDLSWHPTTPRRWKPRPQSGWCHWSRPGFPASWCSFWPRGTLGPISAFKPKQLLWTDLRDALTFSPHSRSLELGGGTRVQLDILWGYSVYLNTRLHAGTSWSVGSRYIKYFCWSRCLDIVMIVSCNLWKFSQLTLE